MWWIIGITMYLAIGLAIAFTLRDTIGMTIANPFIGYPVVILLWPVLLFLFMLGNV